MQIVRSNALVQENEALVGRQQCVSSKRISRKLPYAILHRPCSQSKRRAQMQGRHIEGLLHRIFSSRVSMILARSSPITLNRAPEDALVLCSDLTGMCWNCVSSSACPPSCRAPSLFFCVSSLLVCVHFEISTARA